MVSKEGLGFFAGRFAFLKNRRVTALALVGLLAAAAPPSDNLLLRDDSDGRNWPAFGRTYGEQHFSPLEQINERTVGKLGLAWYYDLPPGQPVSGPVAVNGVLYTATGYSVVRAFEATTGKLLWEYDPKAPEAAGRKLRQGWGSRGLAYWNGKIYVGTQDGRLVALNASTGQEVWSVMTVDKDDVRFISGPPRVFDGKVVIGNGGADVGSIRGYVTTYDAETGKQLWRFWTVPGNPADGFEDKAMEMAAKTWAGEWWKYGGGGTVWNAFSYDAELDQLLIGVGNGSPWNHKIRSAGQGDNLFLASIVALDAKTGEYRWHYQTTPGESWDYNASMDIQVATLSIDGKPRKVVMQAPKNGFFYVIDRTNGKLISAEPIVRVNWASKIDLETGRPVEMPGIRYENGNRSLLWPGPNGGHNWLPMSFDPRTSIVYIPTLEMPGEYDDRGIDGKTWQRVGGSAVDVAVNANLDVSVKGAGEGSLLAWDAVRQKQVWRVPLPGFWNGGTMATAGNLVFQGHADGTFNAFQSATGKKLWSFSAGTGVLAPPITYEVNGKQYVTVISGFGSSGALFGQTVARFGWQYRTQPRRVLTFALGGKVKLPRTAKDIVKPIPDPTFVRNDALGDTGAAVYGRRCVVCHGLDVMAAGIAPDLRASPIVQDEAAFNAVVREGVLVPNGMPRFEELTDAEMAGLRQFLRTVGRDWAEGRPNRWKGQGNAP